MGSKRHTTESFIKKSNEIHNNKYDYSETIFKHTEEKLIISCPLHGKFEQRAASHLYGRGCKKCGINSVASSNTTSQEEFIKRSKEKYNDKYSYDELIYKSHSKGKITLTCNIHGSFQIKAIKHFIGNNGGCKKCGNVEKMTNHEFIERSNKIHNNFYDYSLSNCIKSSEKIDIICPKHGLFKQKINSHLIGSKCPKCVLNIRTKDELIIELNKIHNNFYDYSLLNYINSSEKIDIICPKHGLFKQKFYSHLSGHNCPKCKSSIGERLINIFLDNKNINYNKEYRFNNCRSNKNSMLKFDFYLSDYNICIEYDGKQHFEENKFFGHSSFKTIQENDIIKNKYCIDNNIKLIRIKYTEQNKIDNILNNFLS